MVEVPRYVIIDDYYQNPDKVREFALGSYFRRSLISPTESLVSARRYPHTKQVLFDIASRVNTVPDWEAIEQLYDFWGEVGCGEFQLRQGSLPNMGAVHSHTKGEWTGIIYLSKHDVNIPRPGTFILRHKASGVMHYADVDEHLYPILRADALNSTKWEVILAPDMRYNRLFVFDSRLFHAEAPGFGNDVATGRIIQIFNFNCLKMGPKR